MKKSISSLINTINNLVFSSTSVAECPLCNAAKNGDLSEVKRLLDNGMNPDSATNEGITALMAAVLTGHVEIVKLLLERGANPDLINKYNYTSLIMVIHKNHVEIVKLLLENGANPDLAINDGTTALIIAAHESHVEIVKLLLENKANPDLATNNGTTALIIAAHESHVEIVKLLLENKANPDLATNNGVTALIIAAHESHAEITKLLLENGANPNLANNNGLTALIVAAYQGHAEIIKLLLENKANLDLINNDGFTALMEAALKGYAEIVKLLLENGANPNLANNKDFTALIVAVCQGHAEIAKLLLENEANPDLTNNAGGTPLIIAAYKGCAEIIKILLQYGANPDIRDDSGENAWDLAKDKRLISAILEKHLNDVMQGRQFPPRKKTPITKPNKNLPDSGGGIEARKLPKESNIAEHVFEKTWRSVVFIKNAEGQGSGVIIQPNIVATNCHVVENSNNIEVYKAEERKTNQKISYSAVILERDEANDFCLLLVDGLWGVVASIRKYETINIGENVYGLGAPKGWDLSLSSGLVSQLRQEDGERFIQTDTAISPGSSGGGLFDSEGNLIGIMTKKIVSDGVEGIGFAIPADLALRNIISE